MKCSGAGVVLCILPGLVYNGRVDPETLDAVILKPGEELRPLRGDLWIYDNEIASRVSGMTPGTCVRILSHRGHFVASGYINPRSKITVRILSHDPHEAIDRSLLQRRIEGADRLRRSLRPENRCYRMVYAEADRLPGLVIDRFDSHLVVQITTAGMERFKDDIFSILTALHPRAVIVEKSISGARGKEGLPDINRIVVDAGKRKAAWGRVRINGIRFNIDFLNSQKTGFFLDQRDNYPLLQHIVEGEDVLDVFSYAGAWGLHARRYGARHVHFIEISQENLELTRENVALNGWDPLTFDYTAGDALGLLKEMSQQGVEKGVVILDPPAFVKSKHKLRDGLRGYKEINLRALRMVRPGGFLISCSCSFFLQPRRFIQVIAEAAADARRAVKLIAFRGQPYDHSILLPLYQSEYLKCALFFVY